MTTDQAQPPDLVVFCRQRLDEDERVTLPAAGGGEPRAAQWQDTSDQWRGGEVTDANGGTIAALTACYEGAGTAMRGTDAAHIARHDPARVLREVKAKRELLDGLVEVMEREPADIGQVSVAEYVIPLLAAAWADHPDYLDEWRPR